MSVQPGPNLYPFTGAEIDKLEAMGMHLHHLRMFMEMVWSEAKFRKDCAFAIDLEQTFHRPHGEVPG